MKNLILYLSVAMLVVGSAFVLSRILSYGSHKGSSESANDSPKRNTPENLGVVKTDNSVTAASLETLDEFQASEETIQAYKDAKIAGYSMGELRDPAKQRAAADEVLAYASDHFDELFKSEYESDHLSEKYADVEAPEPNLDLPLYDPRLAEGLSDDEVKSFNEKGDSAMSNINVSKKSFEPVPNLYRNPAELFDTSDEE